MSDIMNSLTAMMRADGLNAPIQASDQRPPAIGAVTAVSAQSGHFVVNVPSADAVRGRGWWNITFDIHGPLGAVFQNECGRYLREVPISDVPAFVLDLATTWAGTDDHIGAPVTYRPVWRDERGKLHVPHTAYGEEKARRVCAAVQTVSDVVAAWPVPTYDWSALHPLLSGHNHGRVDGGDSL